ncbi:vWA domain-containing protein [Acidaminobacter hydrogenoformans]|uniref:VWA-like domain n=1 Tax=Acidaminobacter hydrogenoformans DSM 2784 TaxID=1120920 RepID=A0A1G5S1T0_9FIRM|nr:VWA-like domain-containing protein [Acidaminobacter hydrogenoformans]SCZ79691.1 VWA-like domain [Acidaminobacter hydrogenoformans DSM 2784]
MPDYSSIEAARLSAEIMKLTRDSLMVSLRFMDMALCQLVPMPFEMEGIASDGAHFYYNTGYVLNTYMKDQETLSRDYLHSVLHWVFNHPFVGSGIERERWNLACDITVENLMLELGVHKKPDPNEADKLRHLDALKKELKTMTAEVIYRHLSDQALERDELAVLRRLFHRDQHQTWYLESPKDQDSQDHSEDDLDENRHRERHKDQAPGENDTRPEPAQNDDRQSSELEQPKKMPMPRTSESDHQEAYDNWKKISDRIKMDIESFSKAWGDQPSSLTHNLNALHRETYDYNAFLRRFAVLGEEMQVNEDEYDYIYYTYGLKLYEKVPLIEPLEYKETRRVREFVIAIDTSGSCSGSVVQAFLNKTYNLLKQSESFFSKINLHIIQCDDRLQKDSKITSQVEFDQFLKDLELLGEGGTDFRPVFRYVDELIEAGEFENLKGLIYFTDGFGTYPKRRPVYDTAFVFLGDEITSQVDVPPWAIKLVLPPESFAT